MSLTPAAPAADRVYIDSVITGRLLDAQAAILRDQFVRAYSLAESLIEDYPDDPSGYLSKAADMLAQMSYSEADLYGDRFSHLLDTIKEICTRQLPGADPGRASWLYLFLGHTEAYRSLYEAKFGSSLAAVKAGLRTKSDYSAGLAQDSGLTDLYFGLGSYHYWKSVKAGLFRWLGIFHNDIAQGIAELRRAADSSLLSRDVALSALAWIWLDRKEYDSTLVTVELLRARYPEGSSFLWPAARALFEKKDYVRCHDEYTILRDKLAPDPGNGFNLIECDYYLAICREKSGAYQAACLDASRLHEYERYIPPAIRDRQEGKLRYLRRLIEQAERAASSD